MFKKSKKKNHKYHLVKCSVAFLQFWSLKIIKYSVIMLSILFMGCMSVTVLIYVLVSL